MTERLSANAEGIRRAANLLRAGELVAFPTETVYGLGADGLNERAVAKIFAAKGRPADNPLILHLAAPQDWPQAAASWPPLAQRLAAAFWPGPLTLVVQAHPRVPAAVTAGLPTVAVRCPDHELARQIIRAVGRPIAAPSANRSGRPSPTSAQHVLADLDGRVAAVVDDGPTGVGLESTVVDVTVAPPQILRWGGLSLEALRAVVPDVSVPTAGTACEAEAPRAPGQKYRHYAPVCPLQLFAAGDLAQLREQARRLSREGQRFGLLLPDKALAELRRDWPPDQPWPRVFALGDSAETVSARLFAGLRQLETQVETILALELPEAGLGAAVNDRLRRAAAQHGERPFA